MITTENLASNIRALRKIYGETQKQLGEAIGVSGNTISNYEARDRFPDQEKMANIADHFMVTVEDLLTRDFTNVNSVSMMTSEAFLGNIDTVFPLLYTEEALSNDQFNRAYQSHTKLRNIMKSVACQSLNATKPAEIIALITPYLYQIEVLQQLLSDYEEYFTMIESENADIKELAEANILSSYIFLSGSPASSGSNASNLRSKAAGGKTNLDYQSIIKIVSNVSGVKESSIYDLFDRESSENLYNRIMTDLNSSAKWHELCDYYLALRFSLHMKKNITSNQSIMIGTEMMRAFASVGNPFAANFIKMVRSPIHFAATPQNVG